MKAQIWDTAGQERFAAQIQGHAALIHDAAPVRSARSKPSSSSSFADVVLLRRRIHCSMFPDAWHLKPRYRAITSAHYRRAVGVTHGPLAVLGSPWLSIAGEASPEDGRVSTRGLLKDTTMSLLLGDGHITPSPLWCLLAPHSTSLVIQTWFTQQEGQEGALLSQTVQSPLSCASCHTSACEVRDLLCQEPH